MNYYKTFIWKGVQLFMLAALCIVFVQCQEILYSPIEAAVLEQNWQKVYDECEKDDSMFIKPETSALVGHACIMLNKNNQSFILLKSVDSDSIKREGWQLWADSFVEKYPRKEIGYYFLGCLFHLRSTPPFSRKVYH